MTQQQTITPESTTVESSSSGFVGFILRRLRVAELRAKVIANEIEATATALSAGFISPEAAILMLAETGISVVVKIEMPLTMPRDAERVAESTFQAVAYVLRTSGMKRLDDPWLTTRLAGFFRRTNHGVGRGIRANAAEVSGNHE